MDLFGSTTDITNKWHNTENDTTYTDNDDDNDSQEMLNEIPPPDISDEFKERILDVKHSLYDTIVLSPELGSKKAQSNSVLQEYLNKLNKVYILCMNAQNSLDVVHPQQIDKNLDEFPEGAREKIRMALKWIADFFSKNRIPDTIPYTNFIRNNLHEYQFVQTAYFE